LEVQQPEELQKVGAPLRKVTPDILKKRLQRRKETIQFIAGQSPAKLSESVKPTGLISLPFELID